MLGKALVKHSREFRRNVANHKYEVTPEGIYMPEAHALIRGSYMHRVNDEPWVEDHNLIPDQGLNYFLGVAMVAATQITAWYMALYANAYTPTNTLTAATFPATAGEITSGSEGYSQANRVTWVGDAVDTVNSEVTNNATPAAFTIVTASTLVVNGAALLSVNTKGSTSGTLVSAGRFASARNLSNTDTFNIKYKIDADAV
jgi:hypothetical protein